MTSSRAPRVSKAPVSKPLGRARKVRGEAEILQREAAIASAEVAADLVHTAHLTVRDAGRVLGLSHQRITQLLRQLQGKASPPMAWH